MYYLCYDLVFNSSNSVLQVGNFFEVTIKCKYLIIYLNIPPTVSEVNFRITQESDLTKRSDENDTLRPYTSLTRITMKENK